MRIPESHALFFFLTYFLSWVGFLSLVIFLRQWSIRHTLDDSQLLRDFQVCNMQTGPPCFLPCLRSLDIWSTTPESERTILFFILYKFKQKVWHKLGLSVPEAVAITSSHNTWGVPHTIPWEYFTQYLGSTSHNTWEVLHAIPLDVLLTIYGVILTILLRVFLFTIPLGAFFTLPLGVLSTIPLSGVLAISLRVLLLVCLSTSCTQSSGTSISKYPTDLGIICISYVIYLIWNVLPFALPIPFSTYLIFACRALHGRICAWPNYFYMQELFYMRKLP